VSLYPNDGIALLVEISRTSQGLHGDVIFLDLLAGTLKILRTHVSQQLREIGRTVEYAGCQDGFQLISFLPKIGGRLHDEIPRVVERSIHARGSDVQVR